MTKTARALAVLTVAALLAPISSPVVSAFLTAEARSAEVVRRMDQAQQPELGSIDFPTSGSPAAQPLFIKGVLLIHSFEYDDAREAFQAAQKADPAFAMAYWGEAMTYNHPVWQRSSPDLARAALNRLAPAADARRAKAPTEKEKDWLGAVERLHGPGEKLARDLGYAEAMKRMHEKYPADDEVKSFYALALLGTSHGGRDFAIYMRAAALVEQVYAKNPQHPGAAHYLIHAYDDPIHAPLGLRYADAYSKIAPAASHALHMASHIYVAMGMWDESAATNERSVKAADARREAKKLDVDARGFHALLWLVYSYTQQGRYEEARGVMTELEAAAKESGSERTRSHLALARAAWLIETRKWGEAKAPVTAKGLPKDAAIADLFAIGFAAFRSGNRAAGSRALQQMAALMETTPVNLAPVRSGATQPGVRPLAPGVTPVTPAPGPRAVPAPGTGTASPAPQAPGLRQGSGAALPGHGADSAAPAAVGLPTAGVGGDPRVPQVMAQQLEAMLLFSEGRREEALVLARQAAIVEAGLPFEFGPPLPVKPVNEQVGEMLMDLRRPKEAMEAFELSLTRTPRRVLSLLGLARAATAAKDPATAQRAYGELREIWKKADKTLPELKEIGALRPASSSH
jgi:tetratricopeptide (TPR) repeat protein